MPNVRKLIASQEVAVAFARFLSAWVCHPFAYMLDRLAVVAAQGFEEN
jgi:hypothetical protein